MVKRATQADNKVLNSVFFYHCLSPNLILKSYETFFDGIIIVTFRIIRKCNNLH